jgi:hypothetical protein
MPTGHAHVPLPPLVAESIIADPGPDILADLSSSRAFAPIPRLI